MSQSDFPLISVITPTYNRADLLPETIESVLEQDYPNFEYIILDDGSSDDTQELLRSYNDSRITWKTHPNMGEARTVNKGFSMAQGDYVVVVSSDDPLLPGHLRTVVGFMEAHPDVLVGYPDWIMIDEKSKPIREIMCYEYSYLNMLRWYYCMPGPGTVIRNTAFELEPERDPIFRNAGDFEYWLRLGLHGPFARIPHILATWRNHQGTTTSSLQDSNITNERFEMLDTIFANPKMTVSGHKVRYQSYAAVHYLAGALSANYDRAQSAYHFKRSIILCPFGCRPTNFPRRWRLMLSIIIREILPNFIRRPLGKIKMKLEGR